MQQTESLDEYIERTVANAAKEMQKSIDDGVMHSLLIDCGWTSVEFKDFPNKEILDWCDKTFKKNQWHSGYGYFIFRKKKHAEWFILRWS